MQQCNSEYERTLALGLPADQREPGGGGTDLERGYGDVQPWRPPFHTSPVVRKGPISSKRVSSQDPLLRKFGNFSLYSLNFHQNFSSQAPFISFHKPHPSEILAPHPYLKQSWVPPPQDVNFQNQIVSTQHATHPDLHLCCVLRHLSAQHLDTQCYKATEKKKKKDLFYRRMDLPSRVSLSGVFFSFFW